MSKKPLLQVALDTFDLNSALETSNLVYDVVDIIEVGTILCLAEGLDAVRTIKTLYPENIILADVRVVEAGGLISKMVFDAGADWISVMSSASLATIQSVSEEAFANDGDVQIELQDDWNLDKLNQCKAMGINQIIFHKSRDSEKSAAGWLPEVLAEVKSLCEGGFKVSITGNINPSDIAMFNGIPIFTFVVGRGIRDADDPRAAAQTFKEIIGSIWG